MELEDTGDKSINSFRELGVSLKSFIRDTTEIPIENMKRRFRKCKCGSQRISIQSTCFVLILLP